MSVYTTVETAQLDDFLSRYQLGKCTALTPIASGITNTNYYLDTDAGRYVLTLFEHHSDDELDYILGLQQHLAGQGIACAAPVLDRRNALYSSLNKRPLAAVIGRITGEVIGQPGIEHCRIIGEALAAFHCAGQDYPATRSNPRGLDWCLATSDMLGTEVTDADRRLIESTIAEHSRRDLEDLPRGAIHADLFHDNALFNDGDLGGIIDFDYACHDSFVFDIAVMLNDWAIDLNGEFIDSHVEAIVSGYCQLRPLLDRERGALPSMLRMAAMRFWLSRLYDRTFPPGGELAFSKNPEDFRRLMLLHKKNSPAF